MSFAHPTDCAAGKSQRSALQAVVRPVITSALFFMLLAGIAYPLATWAVAQLLFPQQAQGSLIMHKAVVVGSRHIGQQFTQARYFHGRPSATLGPDPLQPSQSIAQPYNAAASGASNQGATSKQLLAAVAERAQDYRLRNGLAADASVPVDAVTASASGLDPHISVANAQLQAPRVAQARAMPLPQVVSVLQQHTSARQLGLLGEPRVHVLELNLALDLAQQARPAVQ